MSVTPAASAPPGATSDALYFLQSPFISDEMDACVRSATRAAVLAERGLARQLQRLRRGDMLCSFLIDDRNRPVLASANDRALNHDGRNSFAAAAAASAAASSASSASAESGAGASVAITAARPALPSPHPSASAPLMPILSTPTRPLLLYWTDGAKRTLPLVLLKSVALRRGAARLGLPMPETAEPAAASSALSSRDPRLVPDVVVRVMGGSDALNARILDDKCRMQQLLAHKAYVPHTASFDISKPGWEDTLRMVFASPDGVRRASAATAAAAAATAASTEGGIAPAASAPVAASATATAAPHHCSPCCTTRSLIFKPSQGHKQRGILVLPHCALALPRALAHVSQTARPGSKGLFETWVVQEFVQRPLAISGLDLASLYEEGLALGAPPPRPGERPAWAALVAAPAPPTDPAAATSANPTGPGIGIGGQKILHACTPSHPYLPSESGPVYALGMHKLHVRMFAMVRLDARTGRYDTYWANLCKVYHAAEHDVAIDAGAAPRPEQTQQQGHAQQAKSARGVAADGTDSTDVDAGAKPDTVASSTAALDAAGALLFARSVGDDPSATFPRPSAAAACLTAASDPSTSVRAGVAVSAYLCPRLAHHIFPPAALRSVLRPMAAIVVDSVREAIEAGGLQPSGQFTRPVEGEDGENTLAGSTPAPNVPRSRGGIPLHTAAAASLRPGLAEWYFQFLGYDFLIDTAGGDTGAAPVPVLLEVNHNVGQGIPSQEKLARQVARDGRAYGHSNAQHQRRRDYWRQHFRMPFVEGALRINLDAFQADPAAAASAPVAPPPFDDCSHIPLPSSPPSAADNCWIHAYTYYRKSREP